MCYILYIIYCITYWFNSYIYVYMFIYELSDSPTTCVHLQKLISLLGDSTPDEAEKSVKHVE